MLASGFQADEIAVAHIEQLQISHRFLCSQTEKLQREVEQLKLSVAGYRCLP